MRSVLANWRRVCVVIALHASLLVGISYAPASSATSTPAEPIYRLRVTVTTSSTSEALYLRSPADIVTARILTKRLSTANAGVGTFGAGPLSLATPSGEDRIKARYLIAVTPDGASALVFESVKAVSGASTVVVENLNGASASKLASVRHTRADGTARSFSLPLSRVSAGGPVAGTQPLRPRVYSFYYPWYQQSYWFGGAIAGYNRNERPYDSGDPAAIQRHVAQAQRARIDGFISSWFGPGTITDQNLEVVFDQLPDRGFKVGVYFETLSEAFLTKRAVVNGFRYLLTNYASRPQYAHYRGKPVVYIYQPQFVLRTEGESANPRYRSVWRSVWRTLREEGYEVATIASSTNPDDLRIFDGLHLYSTRTTTAFNRQMSLIGRGFAAIHGGKRRTWVVPVAPGYDDRHLEDRSGIFVPRNGGDHYRSQWRTAKQVHADAAVVISFNEWYETTNIEPNRRWGDLYLNITRRKAASYKK